MQVGKVCNAGNEPVRCIEANNDVKSHDFGVESVSKSARLKAAIMNTPTTKQGSMASSCRVGLMIFM